MNSLCFDLQELEVQLIVRGFVPRRMWKPYREIKGDHGMRLDTENGVRPRTSCCPIERIQQKRVRTHRRAVHGHCVDCGSGISRGDLRCHKCGADNYYPVALGLTKVKGE